MVICISRSPEPLSPAAFLPPRPPTNGILQRALYFGDGRVVSAARSKRSYRSCARARAHQANSTPAMLAARRLRDRLLGDVLIGGDLAAQPVGFSRRLPVSPVSEMRVFDRET